MSKSKREIRKAHSGIWTEYSAEIMPGVTVYATNYAANATWSAHVNDTDDHEVYDTLESAQTAAINMARKQLQDALAQLDALEVQS